MMKHLFHWGAILLTLFALGTLSGCSDSNSSGNGDIDVTGTAVMNLSGGNGGSGSGGAGGDFTVETYGDILIKKSGTIDTSFTVPDYPYSFGPVVLTVASGEMVTVAADSVDVDGGYYLVNDQLFLGNGDGENNDPLVTGIDVQADGVLIIEGSFDLRVQDAILINGTLTVADELSPIYIGSESYIEIGENGLITTSATTAGAEASDIGLECSGMIINRGTVEANGTAGGDGGEINFSANSFLFNTGVISANGGDNPAGVGGAAQRIYLTSKNASLLSSGVISLNSGDGSIAGGSGSGLIRLFAGEDSFGDIVVGGVINANGGDGAADAGGDAADIDVYASGSILINASFAANGGDGAAGNGGAGGDLTFSQEDGYDSQQRESMPMGQFKFTGDISLAGGNGTADGGAGGAVSFNIADPNVVLSDIQPIEIIGFATLNLNGGNSSDGSGGDGGSIDCNSGALHLPISLGSVVNEAAISSLGGSGALDIDGMKGGAGGSLIFQVGNEDSIDDIVVTNSGTIDVSGGLGYQGGDAGWVEFYGHDEVTNTATITANGGEGVAQGGNGGVIELIALLNINNSGDIISIGGTGSLGGHSLGIGMYSGYQTVNSGDLIAAGGDGVAAAEEETTGGTGGRVELISQQTPTSNSGSIDVSGGIGDTAGDDGIFWLDVPEAFNE